MLILSTLISFLLLAHGGPRRTEIAAEQAKETIDHFVVLNEELKRAVCDESYLSRAPSLESISDEERVSQLYTMKIPRPTPEAEVISYLLGDAMAGLGSDHVREQIAAAIKSRGLEPAVNAKQLSAEQFLNAQSAVAAVKRRVALDICEGLVDYSRLRKLLAAKPARFLDVALLREADDAATRARSGDGGVLLEVVDREGRFGHMGSRLATGDLSAKYLVPGWLEPFEVERVFITGAGGTSRVYRRMANPVTNNTQSVEVVTPQGVPVGVLFLSHDPPANEWGEYRNRAEQPEARVRQIETYRLRIEFDALRALQAKGVSRAKVRDLQEFYKNLLQAYQLFPNEKQFDTYNKGGGPKLSFDDVTRGALGGEFLNVLRLARVNGSYVHLGLFKPDAKLHAIYLEYLSRLEKLKKS